MKFFKKFQSYGFWVSLSAALVILLNALGKAFGFSIENEVVEDVVMSIAGVLVVLGIVSKTASTETDDNDTNGEADENAEAEKNREEMEEKQPETAIEEAETTSENEASENTTEETHAENEASENMTENNETYAENEPK